MKKLTKMLLLNSSFSFNTLSRNIKYTVTDFTYHMKTAYYVHTGNYDLKQFVSKKRKNIT
jgi:hypothetical protein